ncbi:MAG TPA: hypothetical protein VK861_03805, partial [Bacteroidales bacterium]|nr:hypothetical protein [Bacteroidales bacterium]
PMKLIRELEETVDVRKNEAITESLIVNRSNSVPMITTEEELLCINPFTERESENDTENSNESALSSSCEDSICPSDEIAEADCESDAQLVPTKKSRSPSRWKTQPNLKVCPDLSTAISNETSRNISSISPTEAKHLTSTCQIPTLRPTEDITTAALIPEESEEIFPKNNELTNDDLSQLLLAKSDELNSLAILNIYSISPEIISHSRYADVEPTKLVADTTCSGGSTHGSSGSLNQHPHGSSNCSQSSVDPALIRDNEVAAIDDALVHTCDALSVAPWLVEEPAKEGKHSKAASINVIQSSTSRFSNLPELTSQSIQSISSGPTPLQVGNWLPKFVYNTSEGRIRFLVDTGAAQSFLVKSFRKSKNFRPKCIPESFRVANGIALLIYGTIRLKLDISGREYSHTFLVANVKVNLLGVEFQKEHGLSLVWNPPRLIEVSENICTRCRRLEELTHQYEVIGSTGIPATHLLLN